MNVRFLIAGLALGLLAAGGCAGPNVLTDFDPSAEFSVFRTFAFAGLTDLDKGGVLNNSLMRKRTTCRRNPTPACSGATRTGEDRSGCR